MTKCNAESDTPGVRCQKDQHGDDENHWGVKADGMDVVWASVTLSPPKKDGHD